MYEVYADVVFCVSKRMIRVQCFHPLAQLNLLRRLMEIGFVPKGRNSRRDEVDPERADIILATDEEFRVKFNETLQLARRECLGQYEVVEEESPFGSRNSGVKFNPRSLNYEPEARM